MEMEVSSELERRTHAVRPYGVRWGRRLCELNRALLIRRGDTAPPSPLEKAF